MRKLAVSNWGEEEFDQFKVTHLTRESVRAELETLFNRSPAAMRNMDRELLKKLFLQFEAARTMAPNLQKESADLTQASSIAPNVDAFFQSEGYLTTAQKLFPELQKVAADPKQVVRLKHIQGKIPESGAVPTKSILSGGNA